MTGKNDFGFETTLSTRSYVHIIRQAKKLGYSVVLIYFWLESVDLARARVRTRVEKGGHDIPSDVIERRYTRGLVNFFDIYKDMTDSWLIYDNSHEVPMIIAKGNAYLVDYIYNNDLWKKFKADR